MDVPAGDIARQIRRAYNRLGYPPSGAEAAEYGPHNRSTLDHRHDTDTSWNDVLIAAGVPTAREVILTDLRARYADRYEWDGDRIRVKSYEIEDATGISAQRVGRVLTAIAEGDCPQPDDLTIERDQTARHWMWIVCDGGGESA
ncbi:hypothetical protein C450_09097 [Halococcus salifodinae DSM 8989]|uniref:Uncharacterized protein n=2 Tax=Halococcaceae TaxID=1963270 RepID=M0N6G3_9EURY|nr:hypothetical protein C450_09097 [Halococcus salifodinae DSM 8989]